MRERELGLVRDDASPLRPEPDEDQPLVVPRGEVDEAVDAAANADHAASLDVVEQQLRRVSCLCSLLGREETLLTCRRLEEAVPVRVAYMLAQARNVSLTLCLCELPNGGIVPRPLRASSIDLISSR